MSAGDKVTVAEGWYEIVCAQDTTIMADVYNGSGANGANVWLYTTNSNASQCFRVAKSGTGYLVYVGTGENKVIDCKGYYTSSTLKNGVNLQIWNPDGGLDQRWHFEDSGKGTVAINGTDYQLLNVVSERDGAFVFDANGGKAYAGDNLQVWKNNGGMGQSFAMVPVVRAATRQVTAPTTVCAYPASYSTPTSASSRVLGTSASSLSVLPAWKSTSYDFQVRYRVTAEDGSAGPWTCLLDGSTDAYGWGFKTIRAASSGGYKYTTGLSPVAVPTGSRVEFQVRPCDATDTTESTEAGALGTARQHHYMAGCDVAVMKTPTIELASATWSPLGLSATLHVTDADAATGRVEAAALGYSEAFSGQGPTVNTIGAVSSIPADGQATSFRVTLTTVEGLTVTKTISAKVGYTDVNGSFTASPQVVKPSTWTVKPSASYAGYHVWVIVDGTAHECRADDSGTFWVPVPQKAFRLTACALSGSRWLTWSKEYEGSTVPEFAFTWEGGCDAVAASFGSRPKQTWKESANTDADLTTARNFELVSVGHGRKVSSSVDGSWLNDDGAAETRARAIMDARFCWLTTPLGAVWRVALTGVNVDHAAAAWSGVSFDFKRVDG